MSRIRRMLAMGLLASALVGLVGFSTNAESAPILITPTDDGLIGSSLLTNFDVNAADHVDIVIAPALIQALLTADTDFAGFLLRNMTHPAGVYTIWTVDSGFEDLYQTLAIEYEMVPEPGSLLLVGTALILCARRARRTVEVR